MKRRSRRLLLFAAASALFVCDAAAQEPCRLSVIGTATAACATAARFARRRRELRLAGIEAGDDNGALQTLPGGRPLRLERLGPEQDRYGRLVGFAFVGNAAQSVQQTLLEQGQARVSARVGDKACADALLHAEQAARAAKRGLWADPNFAPLSAENLDGLRAVRGRFTLVEGKVLSVRESGATIYVNFGRRWTRDFSVIILRRLGRAFAAAGLEPTSLAGRRIRVRG